MEQTRQALARTGLANSPFGQEILAGQNMTGNDQIANIGPNMASNFINMAPSVGLDAAGLGTASSAAGLDTRTHGNYTPSFMDSVMSGLQTGSSMGFGMDSSGGLGGSSSGGPLFGFDPSGWAAGGLA